MSYEDCDKYLTFLASNFIKKLREILQYDSKI